MNKQPAVFLDRDGVITVEKGYICQIAELTFYSYVAECITKLHKKGFLTIVITNQSGIARGLFTENELILFHEEMQKQIGLDAIYYCPHYLEGVIKKYTVECNCRKPKTGMIDQACKDFQIDRDNSYMVGDRISDILAGKNAGLKTVLLKTGYGSATIKENIGEDFVFDDLKAFVDYL